MLLSFVLQYQIVRSSVFEKRYGNGVLFVEVLL